MKKMMLSAAIMLGCLTISAQVKLYKTYEDFVNGKYENLSDENIRWTESPLGITLKFENEQGKLVKYKTKDFWAFSYKEHFFRSATGEFAMLQDTGKIYYYINGMAGIQIANDPINNRGYFAEGNTYCFVSVDSINADIYKMPISTFDKRDYKSFKKDHPEFTQLFDCIKLSKYVPSNYQRIRNCVREFNDSYRK